MNEKIVAFFRNAEIVTWIKKVSLASLKKRYDFYQFFIVCLTYSVNFYLKDKNQSNVFVCDDFLSHPISIDFASKAHLPLFLIIYLFPLRFSAAAKSAHFSANDS